MVLATDLVSHKETLGKFVPRSMRHEFPDDEDDKSLCLESAIILCDHGNPL